MDEMTRRGAVKLVAVGAAAGVTLAATSAEAQQGEKRPSHSGEAAGSSAGSGKPYAEETQDAKKDAVHTLFRGTGTAELSGSGVTYRHDWGNRHGSLKLSLNWGAVQPTTLVFVSVGEGAAGGPSGGKFLGSAKFTLNNVAPRAGGVDIWVDIDWGSDIRLYVDYLAINP